MRVLVIGATGFVGKAIVGELRANMIDVVAIGGPRSCVSSGPEPIIDGQIDITDPANIAKVERFGTITHVIHAAGLAHQFGGVTESDLFNVNVNGTENVANLAKALKAKHLILISSVLVYGRGDGIDRSLPITEDFPCEPDEPYGLSKLAAEAVAKQVCRTAGISLTILRPSPIIGKGSKGNFVRLIRLISRRRFVWVGTGMNRKSLVTVEDVARACLTILKADSCETEVFNISGPALTMFEIVDHISTELSRRPPHFRIPAGPMVRLARLIPGDRGSRLVRTLKKWIGDDVYSSDKIRRRYGFVATPDLWPAIKTEVAFYKMK